MASGELSDALYDAIAGVLAPDVPTAPIGSYALHMAAPLQALRHEFSKTCRPASEQTEKTVQAQAGYQDIDAQSDLRKQLELVRDNLHKGMSRSIQKLQARAIGEVLQASLKRASVTTREASLSEKQDPVALEPENAADPFVAAFKKLIPRTLDAARDSLQAGAHDTPAKRSQFGDPELVALILDNLKKKHLSGPVGAGRPMVNPGLDFSDPADGIRFGGRCEEHLCPKPCVQCAARYGQDRLPPYRSDGIRFGGRCEKHLCPKPCLQCASNGDLEPRPSSLTGLVAVAATPNLAAAHVPTYLLVAYRWGWINNSPRTMALTTDFDRAVDLADEEAADTGGKYGVAVYEWTSPDEYRLAHYAASARGEAEPFINRRIELFRSIGQAAHEVVTTAAAFLPGDAIPPSFHPKAGESQVFWSKPEDVPEWLDLLVIREARQSEFMERVQDEIKARKAQQLAPASSDEYARIFEESSEPIVTLIEQRKRDSKSHWEEFAVDQPPPVAPPRHPPLTTL